MKKTITVVLAIALVVACVFLDRSCRHNKSYKERMRQYEKAVNIVTADNFMARERIKGLEEIQGNLQGEIDSANTIISQHEVTIEQLRGKVNVANANTAKLRTEVQPVLDQNPKVAELVASLDAGIALRDSLITDQQKLIFTLKERIVLDDTRFDNQVKLTNEWHGMYDREHELRLLAEDMFKACVKQQKKTNLWGNVKAVAVGVAAGVVVGVLK